MLHLSRTIQVCCLLILFPFAATAQINEWYFSDTLTKPGGQISQRIELADGIVFSGCKAMDSLYQPTVTRIDTNGIVLWQYTGNWRGSVVKMDLGDDSTLLIVESFVNPNNYDSYILSRISLVTGVALFETPTVLMARIFDICRYDSTSFLLACRPTSSSTNLIERYSSLTGQLISSMQVTQLNSDIMDIELEPISKDVFICGGPGVARLSVVGFSMDAWQQDFDSQYDLHNAYKIDYDSFTGQLYIFGERDGNNIRALVARLQPLTGAVIWWRPGSVNSDVGYADHKRQGAFIYSTWEHLYFGGGHTSWETMKVDTSGNLLWMVEHDFQPFWNSTCGQDDHYSSTAIDVDAVGNVYLTGYYCVTGNPWGPANWGIMKLGGMSGNKLFERTITIDSTGSNVASWGKAINVIGGNIYCLGGVQLFVSQNAAPYWNSGLYYVKMNTAGNISDRKFISGDGSAPSTTIDIQNYGTDKTVVLKQVDRAIEVELYNYNEQLLWQKRIENAMPLLAHSMTILENGTICVNAHGGAYTSLTYSTCYLDSLFTFRLDSSGIEAPVFVSKPTYSYPLVTLVGFVNDTDYTYALYTGYPSGTDVFLQCFNDTGFSVPFLTSIPYTLSTRKLGKKIMVNYSPTEIKVFMQNGIVGTINKQTQAETFVSVNNSWKVIEEVVAIDSVNFILTGFQQNFPTQRQGVICKYNTQTNSLSWSVLSTVTSEGACSIVDASAGVVYSAINQLNGSDSSIVLKKIDLQSGSVLFTSLPYNHSPLLRATAMDLAYNHCENEIILAADQHENGGNGIYYQPVFCHFDSSLVLVNDLIHHGDFAGDNTAKCLSVLPNGSVWGGGRLLTNNYGKSGFIFELDSAQSTITISAGGPTQFCPGDSLLLTASGSGPFQWSTGDTAQSIFAYQPGAYQVQSASGSCASLYSSPVYVQWYTAPMPVVTYTFPDLISSAAMAYQWYFNGVPIAGATGQMHIPAVNGNYTVEATYANGCSNSSNIFAMNTVGINSIHVNGVVSITPNPAHEAVIVQMSASSDQDLRIHIVQASGNEIKTIDVKSSQLVSGVLISLFGFAPGVYIIQIEGEHTLVTSRIVVI